MKLGLTANPEKPRALELARRTLAALGGRADVLLNPETRRALGVEGAEAPIESMQAEALIAIGGDGTFLRALRRSRLALLPINAGNVGLLAEIDGADPEALEAAIERLLTGSFTLEDRMKVAAEASGRPLGDATNEIVVHTSEVARMRLFEVAIDGQSVGRVRADGLLVASPTGSTSYALSAGGPIVDPTLDALLVSAIAPFQSAPRTLVVDPMRTVTVRLVGPGRAATVVVDGQEELTLEPGGRVVAYRSARRATFVRFGRRFFERLPGKRILPWDPAPGGGGDADLPPAA